MRVLSILQSPFPSENASVLVGAALDHLSRQDADMLGRFTVAVGNDLISYTRPEIFRVLQLYIRFMESKQYEKFRDGFQQRYNLLTDRVQISQPFKDAQVSDRAVICMHKRFTDSLIELHSLFIHCKTHPWCPYLINLAQ
jgi:hypothetical protein